MWTMDNTDGFTQTELNMINDAISMIDTSGIDASNINDAVAQAWNEQETVIELADAISARLGR